MSDRPRYTPGFAEDIIPKPLAWFDKAAPWIFITMGCIVLGTTAYGWWVS